MAGSSDLKSGSVEQRIEPRTWISKKGEFAMKKVIMMVGLFGTLLAGSISLMAGDCCGCCKSEMACCKDGCDKCDCCK
jgi:hypothetical protein